MCRLSPILFFGVTLCSALAAQSLITVALPFYPRNLLHYIADDESSLAVNSLVFESLGRRNWQTGELEPSLAKSWKRSKDKKTVTFTLDRRAHFFDGKPVTSDDVVFTFNTIRNSANLMAPFRAQLDQFIRCRAIGRYKVAFTSTEANFRSLENAATLFILPKSQFESLDINALAANSLQGSGPYRVTQAIAGELIKLERNSNYWRKAELTRKYHLDVILFRTLSDYSRGGEWLSKYAIDFFYAPFSKVWKQDLIGPAFTKGTLAKVEIPSRLPFGTQAVFWNLRDPLFADRNVRLALAHLFPRQQIIDSLFYSLYSLSTGIFPTSSAYHSPDNLAIEYDPKKATALLDTAGWKRSGSALRKKGDFTFNFTLAIGSTAAERYFTIYQRELEKVGIKMQIKVLEWSALLKLADDHSFDAIELTRTRDLVPGDLATDWSSQQADEIGSANFTGLKDQTLDSLMKSADLEFDKQKRTTILQAIDLRIASLQPALFLWDNATIRVAYRNRFAVSSPSLYRYARWFELFHDWAERPKPTTK